MGLKNMSLLTAATIAASGGTALVFAEDGITVQNGLHLIIPADADYQTRRQATFKSRQPTLDAKTGAYGKDKKSVSYVEPILLADGKVVFNTLRIERDVHPSTPAAKLTDMNKVGCQLLTGTNVDPFWATGSMS